MKLGTLKEVELRSQWKHEAHDFTQWMAKEENIQLLLDELDISAEEIEPEQSAGRYSVDITAKEMETGRQIIIENQLEMTDHTHLGQLVTYASSFDASYIIWVVADYREEHKQAVDWFNEHMPEEINFFLVKIEVWQIDKSAPAVKFNVISEPNEWAKMVKNSQGESRQVTEIRLQQQDFWNKLKEHAQKHPEYDIKLTQKASPKHVYDIAIGTSKANLALKLNSFRKCVIVSIYIRDDELFKIFSNHNDRIESHIDENLTWQSREGKKSSLIEATMEGDPIQEGEYEKYFDWILLTAEQFQKAFTKYL